MSDDMKLDELGYAYLYEKFKEVFRGRVKNYVKTLLVQLEDKDLAERVWGEFKKVQIDFSDLEVYGMLLDGSEAEAYGYEGGDNVVMLISFRSLASDAIFKGTVCHEFMHFIYLLYRRGVISEDELVSILRGLVNVGVNCLLLFNRDEEYVVNILEGLVAQALCPSYLQEGEAWLMRGDIVEGGYVYMSGVGFLEAFEVFKNEEVKGGDTSGS